MMQALSAKELLTQEHKEWRRENKYEEMEGFPSSPRFDDDLRSTLVESVGDAERSPTLEAWHHATQRVNSGPSTIDRQTSLGSTLSYKFAGFEYAGSFPMVLKDAEEAILDCLKSKVFPAVSTKGGKQVVLIADNSTVQVHPVLDGCHSNEVLASLLLRKLICLASDCSTGQYLLAMVVKGMSARNVTAHVLRAASNEKINELSKTVERFLKEARPQSDSTVPSPSSTGPRHSAPSLAFLHSKDALPTKHRSFASMKAKQSSSLPARPRKASLPCETLKHQSSLGRDPFSTSCSTQSKSGRSQQGRYPPPVPPRKSIPEMVKEIKQTEQEIEQLKSETKGPSPRETERHKPARMAMAEETLTLAQKRERLSKKQDSLGGLQRLLIATCETQQELAGVKECFGESWFRPDWERQVAEEVLLRLPPGSFLVRESRSRPHNFALSMKDPNCTILHHLILKSGSGYHLKGVEHANYKQLIDLIIHLSKKQEVLPCTLTLSSPVTAPDNVFHGPGEEEPEYIVPDKM